jgi:aminoglycoside 3-N-acetyltransferase
MLHKLVHKAWKRIKKIFKLRSSNDIKKRIKMRINKILYKKKYTTGDIIKLMKNMGLKKGATVFIHSSWDQFFNYTGTIMDFIDAILTEIGTEGTLAMPAYFTLQQQKKDIIYSIEKTPTLAGMIAETFRRYPNVKRSIDRHAICAVGTNTDYLINEHKYSITSWDEKSPYYKLGELEALIFSIGLSKYDIGASCHCAESILKDKVPYFSSMVSQEKAKMKFILNDGSIIIKDCFWFNRRWTNTSKRRVLKHFDNSKFIRTKISNLRVNMYDAKYLINKIIELGRKGIVLYSFPKPYKKLFNVMEDEKK